MRILVRVLCGVTIGWRHIGGGDVLVAVYLHHNVSPFDAKTPKAEAQTVRGSPPKAILREKLHQICCS